MKILTILTILSLCQAKPRMGKSCHVRVPHAQMTRLGPYAFKVSCFQGYQTGTGQSEMIIRCKKSLKTKVNLCYKNRETPYPFFQSDDPNVGNDIILLDNEGLSKGLYVLNNYEDNYEYNEDNYDPDKDYGDYYDYDYDKEGDQYEEGTNGN